MIALTNDQKISVLQELNSISPRWTKHLATHDGSTNINRPEEGLDIISCNYCIVGEAHKFNDLYAWSATKKCDQCYNFAINVANITISNGSAVYVKGRDNLIRKEASWHVLQEFVKHFKEVHQKQPIVLPEVQQQ